MVTTRLTSLPAAGECGSSPHRAQTEERRAPAKGYPPVQRDTAPARTGCGAGGRKAPLQGKCDVSPRVSANVSLNVSESENVF